MNPQIFKDKEGKVHFENLINPALVSILDNAKELGLNLLNNAKNSMIDKFFSLKWMFHEIKELKEKRARLKAKGRVVTRVF